MEKEECLIEKNEIEEEVSSLSQIIVSPKNYKWINNECLVVVVNVKKTEVFDDLSVVDVCGKSVLDWVLMATSGPEQHVVEDLEESELLKNIKQILGEKKFVFIGYSDTPFLQKSTFCKILDYFSTNGLNALKLERGYVFKTEYLRSITSLSNLVKKSFEAKDFERVDNPQSLTKFFNYITNKIRLFHKKNNVVLLGEETIFIDSDVEIESGSIIYPNNVIKGQTTIGKNVILKSGNFVSNSVILDDAVIEASCILNSKIGKGKRISPLSKIENESV